MTTPDATLPCPRCQHPCPAWIVSRSRSKGTVTYRVWCEAHGAREVGS